MTDKKIELVDLLATVAGVADRETLELYRRLHHALSKEFGYKTVDSGVGLGGIDYHIITDKGTEYVVTVKKAKPSG